MCLVIFSGRALTIVQQKIAINRAVARSFLTGGGGGGGGGGGMGVWGGGGGGGGREGHYGDCRRVEPFTAPID